MNLFIEIVFFVSLAAVFVPYLIYPIGIVLLGRLRPLPSGSVDCVPSVTLLISAFNEASVIRQKIENTLAVDYPSDRLQILVISDASDDGTDEIVAAFNDPRITLCRQEPRGGKTRGITQFMSQARGEIVVFSDANSIYDSQALRRLVAHFSHPRVGYVVGHQRYYSAADSPVSVAENTYWNIERIIKESESRLSSVVGGDGAIFAIRRGLFQPLQDDEINDFVTPLQIIAAGYRGVYEAGAFCTEHTAGSFEGEFRRKVRIVNRSLRGVIRVPQTLNPLRVGLFAGQLAFHKVLRWFVPFLLVSLLAASMYLAIEAGSTIYIVALWGQIAFYGLALLGLAPGISNIRPVYLAYYFCLANLAAAMGVLGVLKGRKFVLWQPQRELENKHALAVSHNLPQRQ